MAIGGGAGAGAGFGVFPARDRRYAEAPPTRYQVRRGDTLGELAGASGQGLDDLIGAQSPDLASRLRSNPDLIHTGERLTMPEGFSPPPRGRPSLSPGLREEGGRNELAASRGGLPAPPPPGQLEAGGSRRMLEMGASPLSGPPLIEDEPPPGGGLGFPPRSVEASLDMDEVARTVEERFWPTMRGAMGAGIAGGAALGTGGLSLGGQMAGGALGGALGEGLAAPEGSAPSAALAGAVGGALGPPVGRAVGAGLGAAGRAAGLLPDPRLPVPPRMTPTPGMGPQGLPPPSGPVNATYEMAGQAGSASAPIPLPGAASPASVGAPGPGPALLGSGRPPMPMLGPGQAMPGLGSGPVPGLLDEGMLPTPSLVPNSGLPVPSLATATPPVPSSVGPGGFTLREAMERVGSDPGLPPVRPVTLGGGATPRPRVTPDFATTPGRPPVTPLSGVGPDDAAFAAEPTLLRGVGADATRVLADVDTLARGPVPGLGTVPPTTVPGAGPLGTSTGGVAPPIDGLSQIDPALLRRLALGSAATAGAVSGLPLGYALRPGEAVPAPVAAPLPAPYAVPQPYATSTTAPDLRFYRQ